MFERHIETQEYLHIPLSAKMYSIDISGKIKNTEDEIVETTLDADGDLTAWLSLWDGCRYYKVAILVALTFKPIHVPFTYWKLLTVLFRDFNKLNLHPKNLVWKFPIGLESKRFPGYGFIPGFTRYVVNREGVVKRFMDGFNVSIYRGEEGYFKICLKPDIGKSTTTNRHRVLGLTWLDYPSSVDELHINHIDGVPGNDDLVNLEWVTPKQNVYHALRTGLIPWGKEILVRNIVTGEITSYYTEAQACKALGFHKGAITTNTNISLVKRKSYMGYDIRLAREREFWDDLDMDKHISVLESSSGKIGREDLYSTGKRTDTRAILIRNVLTGEVIDHFSLSECARKLDIGVPLLSKWLADGTHPICPGYLQIKDKTDTSPWREPENLEEEHRIAVHGRAVLSRNVLTGEVKEYVSARACAFDLGFCELTIAVRLREPGQKVYPGNMQFKHKHDDTPWREIGDTRDELSRRSYPIPVRIRDIYTDQRWEFESLADACIELNIPMHALMKRKDKVNSKPYLNFEFRFNGDEFSNYTQEDLELFKQCIEDSIPFRGRGYRVLNTQTGKEAVFANVNRLIKEIPISQPHLSSLSINGNVYQKKWRFSYYFNT